MSTAVNSLSLPDLPPLLLLFVIFIKWFLETPVKWLYKLLCNYYINCIKRQPRSKIVYSQNRLNRQRHNSVIPILEMGKQGWEKLHWKSTAKNGIEPASSASESNNRPARQSLLSSAVFLVAWHTPSIMSLNLVSWGLPPHLSTLLTEYKDGRMFVEEFVSFPVWDFLLYHML